MGRAGLKTGHRFCKNIRMQKSILFSLLPLVLATLPALQAHHSFAAEFDTAKPVKMTGVVTKVEWQNPDIWFYVCLLYTSDAADDLLCVDLGGRRIIKK